MDLLWTWAYIWLESFKTDIDKVEYYISVIKVN